MAHYCPTCSSPCYCGGDFNEELTNHKLNCSHCDDLPDSNESVDKYGCLYEDDNWHPHENE